jgi:hypothetical protein
MSRKSFALTFLIVFLIVGGLGGVLALMMAHEPEFYRRANIPPGDQRKQWSTEFRRELSNLINGMFNNDKKWGARFSEDQINSYFEEDFAKLTAGERYFFPDRVSAPRVAVEPDHLRVGFRYGTKHWSTIVSLDLRVWVAAKEPNVVALEVQGMRFGAMPIALQTVLECFSEAVRRQSQDIEMSWYRIKNKPVALLRFGPGRPDPAVQLTQLRLLTGAVMIVGGDRSKPVDVGGAPKAEAGPPAPKG